MRKLTDARLKDERVVTWIITSCSALIAYETTALLTKGRVPYITTLVRKLPRGARLMIVAAITSVMVDHFDTRRFL